jgi:hypothetical protein
MKTYTLLILLSLFGLESKSQSIIGSINDSLTNEPITYAHIHNPETKQSTYSNENGEFEISYVKPSDYFVISHISYGTHKIWVTSDITNYAVQLSPRSTELNEIIITDLDPHQLVQKALKHAIKNQKTRQNAKSFYRQTTWNDTICTEMHEVFYYLTTSNQGIEKWGVNQARFASKKSLKNNKYFRFTNISALVKNLGIYRERKKVNNVILPVTNASEEHYLMGITSTSDDGVIGIECIAKPGVSMPIFEGKIYLTRDYKLLRMKGVIDDDLGLLSDDPNYIFKDVKFAIDISFSNAADGIPLLEYVNIDFESNIFKNNKKKQVLNINSSLFVYEYIDDLKGVKLFKSKESNIKQDDRDLIKQAKYNPKFWKDNPIVKRTIPEEEAANTFDQNNSFGNIVN